MPRTLKLNQTKRFCGKHHRLMLQLCDGLYPWEILMPMVGVRSAKEFLEKSAKGWDFSIDEAWVGLAQSPVPLGQALGMTTRAVNLAADTLLAYGLIKVDHGASWHNGRTYDMYGLSKKGALFLILLHDRHHCEVPVESSRLSEKFRPWPDINRLYSKEMDYASVYNQTKYKAFRRLLVERRKSTLPATIHSINELKRPFSDTAWFSQGYAQKAAR